MTTSTFSRTLLTGEADAHRPHRMRILAFALLAGALVLALTAYGWDYYTLSNALRPLSPKHAILKPSGAVGLRLGQLGTLLFLGLYLYPIRKRWPWLARQGNTRHWLDVHVLLGLVAPFVIAFHSSFKFQGFAGVAFWIMTAVALSGVVGRYLYAQIPRSLNAAEVSLRELQEQQARLAQTLESQRLVSAAELAPVFELPPVERVQATPIVLAIGWMMALDVRRQMRASRLRSRLALTTRAAKMAEVEGVLNAARTQAVLSKRILFLARAHQVFHLWHVVHRPFSYSFALLAAIHIAVVIMMGYAW
jgi:hypothetical protein